MIIPRPLKVLLLVLTLWQPLYLAWFVMIGMSMGTTSFETLFMVHKVTMAISVMVLVVYVVHLFKTSHVRTDKKALWGIALFCGGPIAMPVYWFTHLWPDAPPRWPMERVAAPAAEPADNEQTERVSLLGLSVRPSGGD